MTGHCKDGVIVATANLPLFKNVPICQLVSTALNNIPVVLVNDADAALCAEMASNSALTHVRNAALVAVGTGIGVGLMLDGKLHQGHNGLIEAGHMIIDKSNDAPLCGCGQVQTFYICMLLLL